MKSVILYIFIFLLPFGASPQSINDIAKALKAKNISYINQQLDNSVEITFDGKNNVYNKSQAATFLNDFFNTNKISDFKLLHQSESGSTAFFIGSLSTSGGNYRVTFYAKDVSNKIVLREIRFEKQ